MLRFLFISLLSLLLITPCATAQKRTTQSIKQQQQETQREINATNKKIKDNTAKTKRSLNQLNLIEAEINSHEKTINEINKDLAAINKRLNAIQDSIKDGEKRIATLTDNYARAIRSIQAQSSSFDRLLFIFSASSFNQAFRRMRYLQQFSSWKDKQIQEVKLQQEILEKQRESVNEFRKLHADKLAKQNNERMTLVKKRKEQSKVVSSLKKEGKALQKVLAEKQRQARKLDDALNKLIAEEERKAAERARKEAEAKRLAEEKKKQKEQPSQPKTDDTKPSTPPAKSETATTTKKSGYQMTDAERNLSGTFESNKGRILFPVSSEYKIVRPFGRSKHPELKYVQTENSGIDIEVPAGTKARAVFDGKVSAIFAQDGFNTVVMVRHGNYLTIYVNLSEIYVSNGQAVKANEPIGKIFSDPEDDNRTILHFEVRHEREKLNPQEWVK